MRVVIVRHHEEDSAGFIGAAFEARGAQFTMHLLPQDGPLPALDGIDHIVVLGATFSVYGDGDGNSDGGGGGDGGCGGGSSSSSSSDGLGRAWIADELAWLRRADEADVPVLGICFGAQALSAAFGGRVEAAPRQEIGWTVIDSLDPALIPAGPWLEFHGDRCVPPERARLLARNNVGVQAFSLGRHLAVQFHPEVDGAQLRLWLDAGGRGEAERAGQDPDLFLAETIAEEPAARDRADALVASALRIAQNAPHRPERVIRANQ